MAEYEVVHVAVAAPAVLDEGLVKKVSEIIGKNLYETRIRLTGKIPKIIANYSTMQLAELAAQILRGLGLVVIVFNDSELRKPWQIYKARSLKFEEQAITFYDRSDGGLYGEGNNQDSKEVKFGGDSVNRRHSHK